MMMVSTQEQEHRCEVSLLPGEVLENNLPAFRTDVVKPGSSSPPWTRDYRD